MGQAESPQIGILPEKANHCRADVGDLSFDSELERQIQDYEEHRRQEEAERLPDNDETYFEGDDGDKSERKARSQATEMVKMATNEAFLFHSAGQDAYITIGVVDHLETWALKTKVVRTWLSRAFFKANRKSPGSQAIQDAISTLQGIALFDGPELPVFTRLAEHDGAIYLDLADRHWRVVKVDSSGWRIADQVPVKFRRPRGMLPLPVPARGGCLADLRRFCNVASEEDWRMLVAWIIAAAPPVGPYPILCLHGEQGSAKSTTARIIRSLIDPNEADLRSDPRDARDLIIAATNGWVLAYDNLSFIPNWLSDAMCRLSTGGGFGTRELYTDQEETIFNAKRPILLTGINELATRADLLDRCLILRLPSISEAERKPEKEIEKEWELSRPLILGGILDVVASAMKNLPHIQLNSLPRMADFAIWATAAEPALGWPPSAFMAAYAANVEDGNELALEASPISKPLMEFVGQHASWEGTASDLLDELTRIAGEKLAKDRDWPKKPHALTHRLKRIAPNLRKVGIDVRFHRFKKCRLITIHHQKEKIGEAASSASPRAKDQGVGGSIPN